MLTPETTTLSVVVPLFNEEENFTRLEQALRRLQNNVAPVKTEFILVDDGSADRTFELLSQLSQSDGSFVTIKLARNSGSHAAIAAGMSLATGDCAVFMAADGQDPPELIPQMLDHWRNRNYKIVWAARTEVQGQSAASRFFPNLYHRLFNFSVSYPVPDKGVDFALMDREVVEILKQKAQLLEPVFAQITDTGYPSIIVFYSKPARTAGKSGWTLRKKLDMAYLTATYSLRPFRWLCCMSMGAIAIGTVSALAWSLLALIHNVALLAAAFFTIITIGAALFLQAMALLLLGEFAGIKLRPVQGGHPRFCIDRISRLSSK